MYAILYITWAGSVQYRVKDAQASASIDLGLHIAQKLAGAEARARIAAQMDYPYRCSQ